MFQSKPGSSIFIDERDNLWPIPQQEIERNAAIVTSRAESWLLDHNSIFIIIIF